MVAHNGPDADTIGSVLALNEYVKKMGKHSDIACSDHVLPYNEIGIPFSFKFPDQLDLVSYDAVIACDSVERGFDKIKEKLKKEQATVLIDHHPDITTKGDVNIIDPAYSSTCEIIYDFFKSIQADITSTMATAIMVGILGDTGNFQHANTTPKVMEIASDLMKKGASFSKIIESFFSNKKFSTLKLWGKAFEKARINPTTGMIATVLTQNDIQECSASSEDIGQVASILNTVPGTKFSLILSERADGKIKGSLRSEEYKGVDVSRIAHRFGGGGHKLASGFEVKGKIVETSKGWKII